MHCLDLGCGAGDVTFELAGRVAPGGTVVGIDMDEEQLAVARERAASAGLRNVSFRPNDVSDWSNPQGYDVAYCRNVLQHLSHPVRVLKEMWAAVRPAGVLVVEDGDFDGCFAYPRTTAMPSGWTDTSGYCVAVGVTLSSAASWPSSSPRQGFPRRS
jgi:ubiquinone/menaquinone biosynthesis C-methylase UbiE